MDDAIDLNVFNKLAKDSLIKQLSMIDASIIEFLPLANLIPFFFN